MPDEEKDLDPEAVTPPAGTPATGGAEGAEGAEAPDAAGAAETGPVLLTGATGVVGSEILRRLVAAGREVRALVAPGESVRSVAGAEAAPADLRAPETLPAAVAGAAVVVHAAILTREDRSAGRTFATVYAEGTRNLVAAAKAANVGRIVLVSATGATDDAPSAELRMRAAAEAAVEGSGIERVVLRASVLFGAGTRLEAILDRFARGRSPVTLVPGQAEMMLQPVSVADVAEAAVRAAAGSVAPGRYDVAGPKARPLMDLIDAALDAAGRAPVRLHVPLPLLVAAGPGLDYLPRGALPGSAEIGFLRCRWTAPRSGAREILGRAPEEVADWIARRFGPRAASPPAPAPPAPPAPSGAA